MEFHILVTKYEKPRDELHIIAIKITLHTYVHTHYIFNITF